MRSHKLYEPMIQNPKQYIYIPWLEDIIDGLKKNGEDASQLEQILSLWSFCTKFSEEEK